MEGVVYWVAEEFVLEIQVTFLDVDVEGRDAESLDCVLFASDPVVVIKFYACAPRVGSEELLARGEGDVDGDCAAWEVGLCELFHEGAQLPRDFVVPVLEAVLGVECLDLLEGHSSVCESCEQLLVDGHVAVECGVVEWSRDSGEQTVEANRRRAPLFIWGAGGVGGGLARSPFRSPAVPGCPRR